MIARLRATELASGVPNDFILELIENGVASSFDVSSQVIHIRMEKDDLSQVFNTKDILGREEHQ
jgi:hypothetical protein